MALLTGLLSLLDANASDQISGENSNPQSVGGPVPQERETAIRAEKRYDEMLGKMQAAVEEIAQLYGNPLFIQVFTNDEERASELKERLRSTRSGEEVRRDLADLEKRREDLLNDIALKKTEALKMAERLVRQRAALDSLAAAFEQAKRAVEDTTK